MRPDGEGRGHGRGNERTLGRLHELFREMLLIRRFEEKVEERFRAGELPGFLHVAIGQEAVASGVMAALEADDVIASTHRAHGHTIAKGTHVNAVMAELYGKEEGCSKGYGGSMHLYDLAKGNLGANAVVGGGLPADRRRRARLPVPQAAAGRRRVLRRRRHQHGHVPRVAQPRPALEGAGAVRARDERLGRVDADEPARADRGLLAARGRVRDALDRRRRPGRRGRLRGDEEAREHAASGQGPVFLNVRTYRLVGHYIGDPQVYREKSEIEELRETKDPIELLRARLGIDDEQFESLDTEIEAIVEGSVEFAKAGTDPKPEDALKYVYA